MSNAFLTDSATSKALSRDGDYVAANEEIDPFLHIDRRNDKTRHVQYLSMRQWIDNFKPRLASKSLTPGSLSKETSDYIKSAISVALKLTECLIEADQTEQNGIANPISGASIVAAKVLVGVKKVDQ